MSNFQFIQVSPEDLAVLIKQSVKECLPDFPIQKDSDQKEILTRSETARLFSISLVCLHDWMKKKIVKPYKVGNKTFFKHSEVMEVLTSSNRN